MHRYWLDRLIRRLAPAARPGGARTARPTLSVEMLEARDVPSAAAPLYDYVRLSAQGTTIPSTSGPQGLGGFTPAQIKQAYGTDLVNFDGVPGDGAGTTIAIVDAYNDPSIKSDLKAFDQEFGLPAPPVFRVTNQSGGTTLPKNNAGWAGEISLDVEWAHATAPAASIVLVEANGQTTNNLFAAVRYAESIPGVDVVSMSFGIPESEMEDNPVHSEAAIDASTFESPTNPNVVFIASSGDTGSPVKYPATSPYVLAVGGTSLYVNSAGYWENESGWSGSTGGISQYEAQPSYQSGVVTQSSTFRTNPDVSYDANPYTGMDVYESYGNSAKTPWLVVGGTSDASPQWAGLIAITDQGRALEGASPLNNSILMPWLYSAPADDFNTIVGGQSDGFPAYQVTPGYNLVTGLGSPVVNELVPNLVHAGVDSTFNVSGFPTVVTAGAAGNDVTVTAIGEGGSVLSDYSGTAVVTSSDPTVGSFDVTFSDGIATFPITLSMAGTQSITVTDTSNSSVTGSETGIVVSAAAASQLAFVQQPTAVAAGVTMTPPVTVAEEDAYGNIITSDNSTQVTLSLSTNPGSATLTGGGPVQFVDGVASFPGLAISAIGTGYEISASGGGLASAISTAFNVVSVPILENFTNGLSLYSTAGAATSTDVITASAAHPGTGTMGLSISGDQNWYYRTDLAGQIAPGDTVSVWVEFPTATSGRAYFGFGSTNSGTDSVVLAPNSDQLILQSNTGYDTYNNLAEASQTYTAGAWYLVQVSWGTTGSVTADLFSSNGTTLLSSVTAATGDTTPGDFAFRAVTATVYFDTVTLVSTVGGGASPDNASDFVVSGSTQTSTGSQTVVSKSTAARGVRLDLESPKPNSKSSRAAEALNFSPTPAKKDGDPFDDAAGG